MNSGIRTDYVGRIQSGRDESRPYGGLRHSNFNVGAQFIGPSLSAPFGTISKTEINLCCGKLKNVVELMDLEPDNIHIAEYWLQLPPKEILQAKLHKATVEAKARIAFHGWGRCE